jgi:hypothetical protein
MHARPPQMHLRPRRALANAGHDTRALQAWLKAARRVGNIELDARRTAHVELKGGAVRFMDFWGDIHAQHTLLSHHGGRACDCLYFER